MEGDESGLSSYYHLQQQQQQQHHQNPSTTTAAVPAATNSNNNANGAVFSDHHHQHLPTATYPSEPAPIPYPPQPSATVAPPPPASSAPLLQETVKRKRGRPRKYGFGTANPEATQVASPNNLSASSPSLPSPPHKKESSSKKNQLFALGTAGQNFIPHIVTVATGEDVAQKIMSFTQHHKRAVCILSASGSISNASLRQPATVGGNVTYEGRFEILSLSGSYLHSETDGGSSRTGGLSVCLSDTDGHIIGGGVGGPLMAAGPVQVIIGSFIVDKNKEGSNDSKFDTSSSKLPQAMGSSGSSVVYPSSDSHGRTTAKGNDRQTIGVNNFMLQFRAMQSMQPQPTDWRDSPGLTDQGVCQSSEEGEGEGEGDDGEFQE